MDAMGLYLFSLVGPPGAECQDGSARSTWVDITMAASFHTEFKMADTRQHGPMNMFEIIIIRQHVVQKWHY